MVWHGLSGCGLAPGDAQGYYMASVGVAWPQWVWNNLRGCVYDSWGVACSHRVWHVISACRMSLMDVIGFSWFVYESKDAACP